MRAPTPFAQMAKVEQGEVRRILLPRTPVNKGNEKGRALEVGVTRPAAV
jgi:hypothetical protein